MNGHAFRQIDSWNMVYVPDGRGTHPYIPDIDGKALNHVQLPTTLPTLGELIGAEDITLDSVARHIPKMTESGRDQIFTSHAELKGQRLAPVFHKLLRG